MLIEIADRLWIEQTLLGATLNYCTDEGSQGVLFRVGISGRSLRECSRQLSLPLCLWTIGDGSLRVYGDSDEIALSFITVPQGLTRAEFCLSGEQVVAFRRAIDGLASRYQVALN
jgi:hypothetical protein